MKKLLLSCFVLLLLAGCGNPPQWEYPDTPHTTESNDVPLWDDEKQTFINTIEGFSTEFIAYLRTLTPKDMPSTAILSPLPAEISSPLQIYTLTPLDVTEFTGEMLTTNQHMLQQKFSLIFYGEQLATITSPYDIWEHDRWNQAFGNKNASWWNDYYLLIGQNGTNRRVYKNFEAVSATGVESFLLDKETETLYTTHYLAILQNEEYHFIGRALQKNGEGLDTIDGEGSTIEALTIDANGKLIYGKYKAEPGEYMNDYTFTLLKEGGEILDSWTGNFLIYGSYKTRPYEDGIAIGRTYSERPNDISEGRETITPEILDEVAQQEEILLKFYRLVDQQHFEEAYKMLTGSQLSFETFVEKWKAFSLVDIEWIQTHQIFFSSYPASTKNYLQGLGNLNTFMVRLFVRNLSGDTFYQDETLHIHNATQIEILSSLPQYDMGWMHKENIARLYYHLLASHRFEEAYAMQYAPSQSLEALSKTYANLLGISVNTSETLYCDEEGNCGSSSADDSNEWPVQMVIDFIKEEETERLYLELEVIQDKVNLLSTKPQTTPCITCGYGYKPVIYLYPTEETAIQVWLQLQGELTVTYPEIGTGNQWNVIAQPDGTLKNQADGLEYSYLFWEGQMHQPWEIKEGFVVKNEDTVAFLQEKLAYLGLTPREYNEFIVYWRPQMKKNPRNLISFLHEDYTKQATLTITPQPDSMQRVFMVFQWLEEPIEIKEQILKPFERSGFSVIEWGGSEIKYSFSNNKQNKALPPT